jgi:peptidyl-prolyl cis-trans isomerase A (cyclophilin A)
MTRAPARSASFFLACGALALAACSSSSSATPAVPSGDGGVVDDTGPDPLAACTRDPGAPEGTVDPRASSDPAGGATSFGLDQALAGFPAGAGTLTAVFHTEKGRIVCTLDTAAAPVSVANFVGLARGTRPYKLGGSWTLGRFYDGLTWHRVIPGFVIQGGDPLGNGTGGPGYDLPVENHVDEPLGTLAMAAAAEPSGSQLYVVVGSGPAPDYNVFGQCSTDAAVAIASVATDSNDRPTVPVHMARVEIARCP